MQKIFNIFIIFIVGSIVFTGPLYSLTLDFEDLSDMILVDDNYSSAGVHFNEAISLTAGLSLNEFDFPPSSGNVVIGDDWGPMEITFDSAVENIYGNFTYSTQLSFSAYDADNNLIGTYVNSGIDNYGLSEIITLDYTGVYSLIIEGYADGCSFIMDDFNFDMVTTISDPVPEPATMFLLGSGIVGILTIRRKKLT